jgi:tetratricopeptide (TPR) repeat protein
MPLRSWRVHSLRLFAHACIAVCALAACGRVAAQSAALSNDQGIAAYNSADYDTAIEHFQTALRGAPDSPVVRRNLCNAYQAAANNLAKTGKYSDAVKLLQSAVAADPAHPSPRIQIGSYLLRLRRVTEAVEHLEKAIELKPGDLDGHELLGQAYYEDNDVPSARAQWDYVLEMDPNRDELRQQYEKAFREESVEQNFNREGTRHFRISYPRAISKDSRSRVLTLLERARMDIGRNFGGVYPEEPIHVVIYSASQFSEATQLDAHIGAVFDGKIRVPLTDENGEALSPEELKKRLCHEYVHVVVRQMAGNNVPWWLNEGLAETFSGDLDERDTEVLQRAYAEGLDFSLADLETSQLSKLSPEVLSLAYTQSHATSEYLWVHFGQAKLAQLMADLATGLPAEEALRKNFRRTYATLQRDVAQAYGQH